MTMTYHLYVIRCLTNIHVGSGESTFSIVDNEVQRDCLTGFPAIYASSLKGALRNHCVQSGVSAQDINDIFGSDKKAGSYQFFQADLLTRPMRAVNSPYSYVVSPKLINQWNEAVRRSDHKELLLQEKWEPLSDSECFVGANDREIEIEGTPAKTSTELFFAVFTSLLQKLGISESDSRRVAMMSDNCFSEKDLPVVARNHLENGESVNLWYEEVVPRETIFYTIIGCPVSIKQEIKESFDTVIEKSSAARLVQLGANASVGCGYTHWIKL